MTKKEIIKDINKLIVKVADYNKKQKPHSDSDYWSGNIYERLCSLKGSLKE